MTAKFKIHVAAPVIAALLATGLPQVQAQQTYAYPAAGQSQEQQMRDHNECNRWAIGQTGFDPARTPPPQMVQQTTTYSSGGGGVFDYGSGETGQGGVAGDAARGAATGAILGAIAGDAGKGAAWGAAGGTIFGGMKRSSRKHEEEKWRQQQQAQAQQQLQFQQQQYNQAYAGYTRAYAACMSSRNYKIQ